VRRYTSTASAFVKEADPAAGAALDTNSRCSRRLSECWEPTTSTSHACLPARRRLQAQRSEAAATVKRLGRPQDGTPAVRLPLALAADGDAAQWPAQELLQAQLEWTLPVSAVVSLDAVVLVRRPCCAGCLRPAGAHRPESWVTSFFSQQKPGGQASARAATDDGAAASSAAAAPAAAPAATAPPQRRDSEAQVWAMTGDQ
jgi:hypothetical protein